MLKLIYTILFFSITNFSVSTLFAEIPKGYFDQSTILTPTKKYLFKSDNEGFAFKQKIHDEWHTIDSKTQYFNWIYNPSLDEVFGYDDNESSSFSIKNMKLNPKNKHGKAYKSFQYRKKVIKNYLITKYKSSAWKVDSIRYVTRAGTETSYTIMVLQELALEKYNNLHLKVYDHTKEREIFSIQGGYYNEINFSDHGNFLVFLSGMRVKMVNLQSGSFLPFTILAIRNRASSVQYFESLKKIFVYFKGEEKLRIANLGDSSFTKQIIIKNLRQLLFWKNNIIELYNNGSYNIIPWGNFEKKLKNSIHKEAKVATDIVFYFGVILFVSCLLLWNIVVLILKGNNLVQDYSVIINKALVGTLLYCIIISYYYFVNIKIDYLYGNEVLNYINIEVIFSIVIFSILFYAFNLRKKVQKR